MRLAISVPIQFAAVHPDVEMFALAMRIEFIFDVRIDRGSGAQFVENGGGGLSKTLSVHR